MDTRAQLLRAAFGDLENVLNCAAAAAAAVKSRRSVQSIKFNGKTVLAQTHSNILPLITRAQQKAQQQKQARLGQDYGAWQLTVQEPLADLNQEVVEGFNVMLYAKIFLFIFLLDLDSSYFTITAAIFFLHANGLFGPIGRWLGRYRLRAARHRRDPPTAPEEEEQSSSNEALLRNTSAHWSIKRMAKQILDVLVAFIKSLWPVTEN